MRPRPPDRLPTRCGKPLRKNNGNQTYLPAFKSQTRAHPRFSGPDEVSRRSRGDRVSSCQGPQTARRLKHSNPPEPSDAARGAPRQPLRNVSDHRQSGRSAGRLRRPPEFAAVLAAPRSNSLRAARLWLAMTAAWVDSPNPDVRFGITVSRRHARRAVDRALIKRIVREAGRRAWPALHEVCAERGIRIDVAFRLKTVRPAPKLETSTESVRTWRRSLRAEADGLLERTVRHLRAPGPA